MASSGGHLTEALRIFDSLPNTLVTVITTGSTFSRRPACRISAVFHVIDPRLNIVYYLINFFQSIVLVARIRPRLVLTTGSGMAIPFSLIARLFGANLICVDSLSAVAKMSRAINFLSNFAALTIVHWPWLEDKSRRVVCYRSVL